MNGPQLQKFLVLENMILRQLLMKEENTLIQNMDVLYLKDGILQGLESSIINLFIKQEYFLLDQVNILIEQQICLRMETISFLK
jgi:hypothetical protein